MTTISQQLVRLAIIASIAASGAVAHGEIFSDNFDDNSVSSSKWTSWGTSVAESGQIMQVLQNQTDAGGNLKSIPIAINPTALITISRTTRVHYANSYFMGSLHLAFGTLPQVSIRYGNMSYNGVPHQSVYGFFISRNAASPHSRSTDPNDISSRIEPIWDTWFTERIMYDPRTGDLSYYINDVLKTTFNVGPMPQTANQTLTIHCDSWGWWTGHQHSFDNIQVSQDEVTLRSLPDHQPVASDGRQAVKSFQMTPGGQCSFIFSTPDPGSMCLVSWTNNLRQWFPLIQFNTANMGTEVVDTPRDPQKFYRTTYLPTGVSSADSFDYPIGSGSVPEQITPERNTLYPSGAVGSPDRGAAAPNTSYWYNAQDVGSYYAEYSESQGKWLWEGLHPGEDWNKADDVGESVLAIANGQVIEIRPAGASGIPTTSGYAVVIRHWLSNGDSVDSLYVHIAPGNNGGVIGDKSEFTYQVGAPVSKGSIIGVVGAVSALPPHLHFEMRNKPINVLGSLWPKSTGDAYYGPEVGLAGNRSPSISQSDVEAACRLMQDEGIIDPSDFIDDHR